MLNRRAFIQAGTSGAVAASLFPGQGWAQGQANVVKMCVPYTPGGATDSMARIIAESMSKTMQRTVIIENRAGAGAIIGTKYVQMAPPDGNTILFHNSGFVATPMLQKTPAYDPIKAFEPVAMVGNVPNFLIVHDSVPAKTIPEFITYCRSLPLGIECGNSGVNTGGHISALMLEKLADIKMLHVPFKGSSEVTTALISGQIKMQVSIQTDAMAAHIKSGKLRVLGVATSKRSTLAPDVPAISEFVPGYSVDGWYGVLAPTGTPLAVREALASAIKTAIEQPANHERLAKLYLDVGWRNPVEFGKVVVGSVTYYHRLVETLGLVQQ